MSKDNTEFENKAQHALEIIRKSYAKLMSRQFFYYNIANQFALKAVDKKLCPTMGVAHQDNVHWLVYNPDFIKYYNYEELSAILEHEICHFTFDHVKHFESDGRGRKVFKDEDEAKDHIRKKKEEQYIHKTKNICTDRSINVYLFGLPNIRMSFGDIKMDFTDKEGKLNQEEYDKHIAEMFSKGKMWFKDSNMTMDKSDDDTVVECNCITEDSFKSILTEAGYEGDVNQVKKYETWKYYFDLLMSCPRTKEAVKDIKEMDIHFGDEGDENGNQEAREKILIEAAKKSNKHDIPGNLRQHIKELFDKYSKKDTQPWNVIFRKMVNASKKSIMKNDINSRNRYAPGRQILPFYKLDPIKDVCLIWDVSGSCMDEETQTTFISEANAMIKAGSTLKVLYTDAQVEHEQICDKEKPLKPNQYEVTGGGGTNMDPAIKQAIAEGYKIIINLTDCYVPYNMTKKDLKGRKVITVSTTSEKAPKHYGPTIHCNNRG